MKHFRQLSKKRGKKKGEKKKERERESPENSFGYFVKKPIPDQKEIKCNYI